MRGDLHLSIQEGRQQAESPTYRNRFGGLFGLCRVGAVVTVLVLAFVVVPTLSPFYVSSAGQMAAYAIVAMGASIVIQHANLASIGHGAFFGIAGYTVGLVMVHEIAGTVLALLASLVVAGISAALIGLLVVRMTGAYFMIVTLAIGQLLAGTATSLTDFTGGANGLTGIPVATIGPVDFSEPLHYYLICMGVLAVVALFVAALIASPFGHALRALKHDDRRVRSLGIAPLRVKLVAFVVSGVITGLGGALYTLNAGYAVPANLAASSSGLIFMMVVLVNRFGVLAPILGAFVVEFIRLIVGAHTTHYQLILGVTAVLMALFLMRPEQVASRPEKDSGSDNALDEVANA